MPQPHTNSEEERQNTDTYLAAIIYSNKKDTSDFHGTVSFDPIKMSQQKIYQNVNQTSDTQKLVII